MKSIPLLLATISMSLGTVASHAAEKIDDFTGAQGIYHIPGRQHLYQNAKWKIREVDELSVVKGTALNSYDSFTWQENSDFCKHNFQGTPGWRMPTEAEAVRIVKKNMVLYAWTNQPQMRLEADGKQLRVTERHVMDSGLCVLDTKKLATTPVVVPEPEKPRIIKPVRLTAERVVPQGAGSVSQTADAPPDTSAELKPTEPRKTYPFTQVRTYTSTYRNTSQEQAMTTVQAERVKLEPLLNGYAATWEVTSVSKPLCGRDGPSEEYWICEISVGYRGMSYLSKDIPQGPSRVMGR